MTDEAKTGMVPTGTITRSRFNYWTGKLALEDATPLLVFGVGHNRNSGKLVILTVEDEEMDTATIRALLHTALAELR